MITLTVQEIKDLAMFAGILPTSDFDADDMESEISITLEPQDCVNDDGKTERYAHVAYITEYPEEGCMPLGSPIAA